MIKSEEQKENNMKKNEQRLWDLWDTIKCTNVHIIWVPAERREWGRGKIFKEIIIQSFLCLLKYINLHIEKLNDYKDLQTQKQRKLEWTLRCCISIEYTVMNSWFSIYVDRYRNKHGCKCVCVFPSSVQQADVLVHVYWEAVTKTGLDV